MKTIVKDNFIYFINEENKTIVCKFNDLNFETKHMVKSFLKHYDLLDNNEELPNLTKFIDFFIQDRERYKNMFGKAICMEEDTFDEELGMRLARERLLTKFYFEFSGTFVKTFYYYSKIAGIFKDSYYYYFNRFMNHNDTLTQILKDTGAIVENDDEKDNEETVSEENTEEMETT